jgi:predicted SAM-dependent methyltransferase
MKLNLGCGRDLRPGYVNVDFRPISGVDQYYDLSKFPWPWADGSAEEILMLDFLEHFPYRQTYTILHECWRVLAPGGKLIVQVPDLEQCGRAALMLRPHDCNKCGYHFGGIHLKKEEHGCPECGQTHMQIARAAVQRLYGGQDYEGNFHHNAFMSEMLVEYLERSGFEDVEWLEVDHQRKNWNMMASATKGEIW